MKIGWQQKIYLNDGFLCHTQIVILNMLNFYKFMVFLDIWFKVFIFLVSQVS